MRFLWTNPMKWAVTKVDQSDCWCFSVAAMGYLIIAFVTLLLASPPVEPPVHDVDSPTLGGRSR